jgi:hypothetical protein
MKRFVAAAALLLAISCSGEKPAPTPAAAAPTIAPPTPAPTPVPAPGWRYAKWGMSVDDLLKASGGEAVAINKPKPPEQWGAVARAEIRAFELAGLKFSVQFYFDSAGLRAVYISTGIVPQESEKNRTVNTGTAFRTLSDELTAKYGQSVPKKEETKNSVSTTEKEEQVWTTTGTSIELMHYWMYLSGKGASAFTSLTYKRTGTEAGKL